MSSVFRAVHIDSGNEVALKVLTRSLARNSTLLQRFLREARSAESLEHANIVTLFDRGIDRGRHYLVLEYVPGGDFHDFVQRRGPLDVAEAVSVVRSVASGLEYAAGRGLIHRDIKPSNILRTPAGQVKIIDLGLALQSSFEDERVTREGTTVGTVDYMAPEQARDSRATSIQSDIYSLGCTLFYLLTGQPPYAGGDITDKLTRHVKAPVPSVQNLRPEVPKGVSAVLERMMAKRPEDRFASYAELISALDHAPEAGKVDPDVIELVPLADDVHDQAEPPAIDPWPSQPSAEYSVVNSDSLPIRDSGVVDLAWEPSSELELSPAPRSLVMEPPAPLLRRAAFDDDSALSEPEEDEAVESLAPPKGTSSAPVWVLGIGLIGLALIVLTIGVFQIMDSGAEAPETVAQNDVSEESPASRLVASAAGAKERPLSRLDETLNRGRNSVRATQNADSSENESRWIEPTDVGNFDSDIRSQAPGLRSRHLPDWAKTPIPERIDGPFVTVRRIPDGRDPSAVPTLHAALDSFIGGTIELADEGPHFIDDLRVSGESRLIRARRGFRPIVRIERSSSEAVRKQRAVFVLEHKNLTLEGIDLILDVRELSTDYAALFACVGANLTLRNCSITILNENAASFDVVHIEDDRLRPTRIRLEQTLVRGRFTTCLDVEAGDAGVAIDGSVLIGGAGPIIRIPELRADGERRFYLIDSVLAGPGPIIQRSENPTNRAGKPIAVRAFRSVFARLHGGGLATVILSSSPNGPAAKQIDWEGDNNLFAGWKGFFATGNDVTVTVADLAAVRSTWNGAERESREILAAWPHTSDFAATDPLALTPFVPNREEILKNVAHPRAGLLEKAVSSYPAPETPQSTIVATDKQAALRKGTILVNARANQITIEGAAAAAAVMSAPPYHPLPLGVGSELSFNTETSPWDGDMGLFLRDRLATASKRARVRVIGSGTHPFTPVTLPEGIILEIHVERLSGAKPPAWVPATGASGPGLISLRGGALVLSNLELRHQDAPALENLIYVEAGHLVLWRCQFFAPGSATENSGNLVAFRSPFTRPLRTELGIDLFSRAVDHPVCRVDESILITGGVALTAELGRGVVVLSDSAVAAGLSGVMLVPSKVARNRFDADLIMERCTLTAERNVIKLGPWRGASPGPDRPWLITSRNCAFVAMFDRRTRETVLLRADADALSRGAVSWQAVDDAVDVDFFVAAGDAPPSLIRPRDVLTQWIHFWGYSHVNGRITGPRGGGSLPSVRFWDRLHPGRIEPPDLVLNPDYHPDRERLNVGADLGKLGIAPRSSRYGRPRN
jgi:serine/threonine-protein kinase